MDFLIEQGEQELHTVHTAVALTYDNMLQMATFVANDAEVQTLFRDGAAAVAREGGGAGGPEAAAVRQRLYERVHAAWARLTDVFGFRQLHFHLPPGSTSFLRVHQPDRFGDDLSDVRHTVVAVNETRKPVTGFETGRVYAGLRGIVPVYAPAPDGGERVFVGALEAGTSFQRLLTHLRAHVGVDIAILLQADHVESVMWPSGIATHLKRREPGCGCYVEAATADGFQALLPRIAPDLHAGTSGTRLLDGGAGRAVAVTVAPLPDFAGERSATSGGGGAGVGSIILWRDVHPEVAAFERDQRVNLASAMVAFLVVEGFLYMAIMLLSRRLEEQIAQRTNEVQALNAELLRQATTDSLTGLANRRHFLERLQDEVARTRRTGTPLTVALLDVDHFKRINDGHGHGVGDAALHAIAECLRTSGRRGDLPARYGGEEFTILLPDTGAEGAAIAMEALRRRIAGTPIAGSQGTPIHLTVSAGLATLEPSEEIDQLLKRADDALYGAKAAGRNRVRAAAAPLRPDAPSGAAAQV